MKIQLESLALYEGKFKVRSVDGLHFPCNPNDPDGYFLSGRRGEYGLYVEGRGWVAFDTCCYMASTWTKEKAKELAKTKGVKVEGYFCQSSNEHNYFLLGNIATFGRTELQTRMVVEYNAYSLRKGNKVYVNALDYRHGRWVAESGSSCIPAGWLTTESKMRLADELKRTLASAGKKFKYYNKKQCKLIVNKSNETNLER